MFDKRRDIFSEAGRKECRLDVEIVCKEESRTKECPRILFVKKTLRPPAWREGENHEVGV